jgi:hypothetical protein
LQSGIFLLAIPALTWLIAAAFLMLRGMGRDSAILLLVLGFAAAAAFAYAHGRATFKTALGVAVAVTLLSLALCRFFVDLSYDGQDYHYTAIWALAHGWNPFRFGHFGDYIAPASDREPWAPLYPKGDWLYPAVERAAGIGSEAAKNSGAMLLSAALLIVFAVLRRLGMAAITAAALALCAAANPVSLSQVFTRMCDGRLGSLAAIFIGLGLLAAWEKEWRYLPAALLAMALAVNTKFSMIPVFLCLGAGLCLAVWLRQGVRPAALLGAGYIVCVLIATFAIGWDPYLRNAVRHGHPFYPIMGANRIDTMWDWRPPALAPHGDLTGLAMSLASRTGYDGPDYKIPLTMTADEFAISGDPEPRFAGFGPFFLPALLAALAGVAGLALGRPGRRGTAALLLAGAAGVLLSTLTMPESWLARYVPQFWLFAVLAAAAATRAAQPAPRLIGWAAAALLLVDAGVVAASSLMREGPVSLAIHRQIAHYKADPENLCAYFAGSPARLAMLTEAGLKVAIRSGPPPKLCRDDEPMPDVFYETGDRFGDICHCPSTR